MPGAPATGDGAINDRGEIAGTSADSSDNLHGFVGFFTDASDRARAFLLRHGAFTTFDAPGAVDTVAEGINNRGGIVGHVFLPLWFVTRMRISHSPPSSYWM